MPRFEMNAIRSRRRFDDLVAKLVFGSFLFGCVDSVSKSIARNIRTPPSPRSTAFKHQSVDLAESVNPYCTKVWDLGNPARERTGTNGYDTTGQQCCCAARDVPALRIRSPVQETRRLFISGTSFHRYRRTRWIAIGVKTVPQQRTTSRKAKFSCWIGGKNGSPDSELGRS